MDPVTLIVTAIIAGASETVTTLVSEAYGALKSKIHSLFERDPVVKVTVDAVEASHASPDTVAALTQVLSDRDLKDRELGELAEKVRQAAGPAQIENAMRLAENAVAENNKMKVTASPGFDGTIQNEMELGKGARATGNDMSVTVNDSSEPLPG